VAEAPRIPETPLRVTEKVMCWFNAVILAAAIASAWVNLVISLDDLSRW
jgi:hypothetical protein